MKQMCKKKYPSPRSCRNELSNPRYLTVSVNSTTPRLQTIVRQRWLESSIRHERALCILVVLPFYTVFNVSIRLAWMPKPFCYRSWNVVDRNGHNWTVCPTQLTLVYPT